MNIYDIASEAGVSIATISRVLNSPSQVKKETRERVEAILKKNDYQPNAAARGLVTKTMRTIGVLTMDIRVIHYAKMAYAIEQSLSRIGYNVMLCNTGGMMQENLRYLRMLSEKRVDGVMLIGSVFSELAGCSEAMNVLSRLPVAICCNGVLPIENARSVMVDDRFGIRLAVQHLIKIGRHDLRYVQDMDTRSAILKAQGFEEAAAAFGVNPEGRVMKTSFGLEGGRDIVRRLLEEGVMPDGLVFGEDLTAVGVMKALKEAGIDVPGQVAIVGFNDSDYAQVCSPALTSVDNKFARVGERAVDLLASLLEKTEEPVDITLRPTLVLRESA